MTEALLVALVHPSYGLDAIKLAKESVRELASRYQGLLVPSKRVAASIVTSLSDAEMVGAESRRYSAIVALLVTGRTARLLYSLGANAERPLIPLVLEASDSLPDALEAHSMLRERGVPATTPIVYPREEDLFERALGVLEAVARLQGAAFIQIGSPAEWLLYAEPSVNRIRSIMDSVVVKMDLNDLVSRFEETPLAEADHVYTMLEQKGVKIEADGNSVLDALRLAVTLEKIALDNRAAAITVNCLELSTRLSTTACLAASLLLENDSVPVACEGDLTVAVTAAIFSRLAPVLIAKPMDVNGERVIYASCSPPLSLLEEPVVKPHPRLKGVVLAGRLRGEDDVLVARLDSSVTRLYTCRCKLEESHSAALTVAVLRDCGRCARRIPGANHVLVLGLDEERLGTLLEMLSLKRVLPG